jgi:PAS domain S-box-containing protein
MPTGPEADALRLRRALRDLVALSTVPAAWVGREPPAIVTGLADVLVNSLHLDFAFVRLCDPNGGAAVEIARGSAWQAFPEWLQLHLAVNGRLSRREIVRDIGSGAQRCRGIIIPIGVAAEGGLVAAACDRADFPTEIDQLLLSVAANHAATAFRTARILDNHRLAEEAIRESEQQLRKARDELETKVAERTAELQRSEAYLAEAQRLSHTGSLGWHVSTGKLYWSEETFRIFECDRADEPTVEFVLQRTHPDDRARVQQTMDRAVQERKDLDFEHRLLMPDGSVKYVNVVGLAWKEDESGSLEFVGAITDITARKHAEEILRRSEAYLSEAQRLSHTGSWAWIPATGEITYWSEETFRVLGFDPAGGLPRFEEFLRRIHSDDQARTTEHFETAIRKKADFDAGYRIVYPGGEIREIHAIGHPVLGPSGDLVEFVGTVMDVTERRRAEEERQALAHANRITTMGQLTASIAHEVNQPIAAVVTNAQAALRWLNMQPPDPEEVQQALDRIVRNGRRADDVIGRIRALVAKAAPQKDRLDINDTIREVIALTRSELHRNGTSLQTQLADGLPLVPGDRIQLQQVMLNLILNAVEAMSGSDEGSRELLISTEEDGANGVRIAVRDWGPGLKPESLDRLFDAFYTTKPGGMGMGLSICRSIIEAHGGRVWATPNLPQGAAFRFTLPQQGQTAS